MQSASATLLTGAASGSLGSKWLTHYRLLGHKEPVIVFDKEPDPEIRRLDSVYPVEFDLNPLVHAQGYTHFVSLLKTAVEQSPSSNGIGTAVLCAGAYEAGGLTDMTLEARTRVIGVNVCGQIEVLHAILSLNQRCGVDSSSSLSYVQIGSLHGLTSTAGRSVYAATKGFGVDLCLSLSRGGEVRRVIYVAPGPIDTPMLHRNHWVSKENGCVRFFDFVRTDRPALYQKLFMQCNDAAFRMAISTQGWDLEQLAETFERYKRRRAAAFSLPEGVLSAADMAKVITTIVGEDSSSGGVYVITAPEGQMKSERIAFEDMVRW